MRCPLYLINLDHRTDRLTGFYENLVGGGYQSEKVIRVPAVFDPSFGGLGCAKSHFLALSDFISRGDGEFCAVMEDDFRFRISRDTFVGSLNRLVELIPNFSVYLLAGTELSCSSGLASGFFEVFESQSASGYLVRRSYIPRLLTVYCRSILMMERYRESDRKSVYHKFAIDQTWKSLQQEGGWYCSIPMPGFQVSSHSDIESCLVDYSSISA